MPNQPERSASRIAASQRLTLWTSLFACWNVFGLIESTRAYLYWRSVDKAKPWSFVLLNNMPWWWTWAALTPLVGALARRFPVDGPRWRRNLAVHVIAGPLVTLAHLAITAALFYLTSKGSGARSMGSQIRNFENAYFATDLVTYLAIAGAAQAIEFAARVRQAAVHSARLEAQAARLQLGLAEARMQALRMELNPHFLFNAMNAIAGLVRRREHDAAVEMLARLSDLLKATLGREMAPEIPLREELELVQRFVDIELVRFGDRLSVQTTVHAAARNAFVPPLLLQPLVENAIRHGVSRRPGPAAIHIAVEREGDDLAISVRDTGGGLALMDGRSPPEGVGLSNTRARLAEMYGPSASLDLSDAPGGGAMVLVRLPYHDGKERTYVSIEA